MKLEDVPLYKDEFLVVEQLEIWLLNLYVPEDTYYK